MHHFYLLEKKELVLLNSFTFTSEFITCLLISATEVTSGMSIYSVMLYKGGSIYSDTFPAAARILDALTNKWHLWIL